MFRQEMDSLDLGVAPDLLFSFEEPLITADLLNDHAGGLDELAAEADPSFFGDEDSSSGGACYVDTDMLIVAGKPSDVTGQSLVSHMEDDKQQVLLQMTMAQSGKGGRNHLGQDFQSSFASSTHMWLSDKPDQEQTSLSHDNQHPVKLEASVEETDASTDETQSFIDELQEFMDTYERQNSTYAEQHPEASTTTASAATSDEGMMTEDLLDQLLTGQQQQTLESMDAAACPLANSTLTDEEAAAAELMLDALLKGDITTSDDVPAEVQQAAAISSADDSGYHSFNASNVTEIVTEDGRKVIIVVAPEDMSKDVKVFDSADNFAVGQQAGASAVSFTAASTSTISATDVLPSTRSSFDEDAESISNLESDDSDWMPESPAARKSAVAKRKPGRKPELRFEGVATGRVSKLSTTIKDKKERKKQQNVEAARRYRDKKKSEQQLAEEEEKALMEVNKKLKGRYAEVESELKTLKKLMAELGLIKLMQRKK